MQRLANQSVVLLILIFLLWNCSTPKKTEQAVQIPVPRDSGTLVLKNGQGGIIYQKFSIKGDSIYTRILSISDKTSLTESVGLLKPEGTPDSLNIKTFMPTDSGTWIPKTAATVIFKHDSIMTLTGESRKIIPLSGNHSLEISFDNMLSYTPLPFSGYPVYGFSDRSTARRSSSTAPRWPTTG